MERVISRADLLSPAGTPDPETDTEPTAQVKPQKFKFVTKTSEADTPSLAKDNENLLDFRLFAPTSATGNTSKIRLRSPTPQTTAPAFVVHERNLNYYFAEPSKSADKDDYKSAALSGAEIVTLSRTPWPGSAYPWKVIYVSLQGRRKSSVPAERGAAPAPASLSAAKRKQPGKKARIQIRVKLAAQRAESDKQQVDAKAREITDREKRVRLNRAKTLRKRAREKARKAGVAKDYSDGEGD
ncbi:hypothetical protein LTR56_006266 [Elasticomyces elasticus]|nr:hypothetical protein LTR56_006266 [Elasticomyces elasticus]KAK3666525.1 hypothetical protein LTR22_002469 [Elasticomyces elasticus]KAK4928342.1 hypothetical protein LTR49_005019 [Elasticomyces elasticus]KAK5763905.1 hypothetical protein LTS12_006023 [Elasticomyces elasticus]